MARLSFLVLSLITTNRSVSLSANLPVGLRLPERMIKKQLTPLYVVIGHNPILS